MTTITEAYINSLLADATYALDGTTPNFLTSIGLEDRLKSRMTPALAEYIGDNFTVVTHIDIPDVITSGFDATVWRDNRNEKIYVSMTGSQLGTDFYTADVDLSTFGLARGQVRDMINWWLKNTTPVNELAQQVALSSVGIDNYIAVSPVLGTGLLSNVENVTVNGHSLGGHLATAFARIFGGQWSIDHVYTYNSAGYTAASGIFFDAITDILGPQTGLGDYPDITQQTNFFAQNGINVTTRTLLNGQAGLRTPLFNEEGTGFPNHLIYKLTDALALGNLIEGIDSSFNISSMNDLFEAGSNQPDESLEHVLDSLRRLFLEDSIVDTPIGDGGDSLTSRVKYHENLAELKEILFLDSNALMPELKSQFENLSIITLINDIPLELKVKALGLVEPENALAYRYSLVNLTPFVVTGDNAIYQDKHNQNGELDLYDEETGLGQLTETYIEKRAEFLTALMERNQQDIANEDETDITRKVLYDLEEGIRISKRQIQNEHLAEKIIFGSESGEPIEGSHQTDYLFGMGGNDIIHGGNATAGATPDSDYIEGGEGDDKLSGGNGTDILIGGKGDDRLYGNNPNNQNLDDTTDQLVKAYAGNMKIIQELSERVRKLEGIKDN